MALQRASTADKIIVDRRKAHRNSDVARTVRKTRDRLAQKVGNPAFDRELLKLHAHAMVHSAAAIPLMVAVIAAAGSFVGMTTQILVWALVSVTCYAGLAFVARRTDRADITAMDPVGTARIFLIAHFISGLGWAYFASIECDACRIDQFSVVKAVVLLLAIAATAIIASSLRGALVVTFVVPVLVYAYVGVRYWQPIDGIMIGLLVVSLPFFSYVAGHLYSSAVMFLAFRSEKDALIAELETAKAMSDEARRRAEDANLAKSRFLASMSHELRTPLNAILGFSEVMAKEVLGPIQNQTYRDYANDIHESGQHLLHLINEILDLSRIEAGRYQLNEEAVNLAHLVEECCHMMELKARNKDIRILQQFEPTLPRLFADERAVRQITLNLLSNAIKFTPSGGEVKVRVGWTAGGGQYVSVRDNGPGIPADEIPIVLSAFGQGSIAIKSAEQGTGLGLPIVQGLLAMHGGEFELHSKLREGTEAIAIFPSSRVMEVLPAMPTKEVATAMAARRR
jgi:two-component system cell cycle sensor histidine kinase PleC